MTRRSTALLVVCGTLVSCTTVDVLYEHPAASNDVETAVTQAKADLSFYALQKIRIDVGPSAAKGSMTPQPATQPGAPASGASSWVTEAHPEAAHIGPPQNGAAKQPARPNTGTSAGTGSPSTGAAGTPASGTTGKDNGATNTGNVPSTGQPSGIAATIEVGDKEIAAKLVALPDADYGFMMGGTSGFWQSTALTGTRYADSDRVQSLSVKAQNLVAKRIGQVATIVGYFISPTKGVATAEAATIPPSLASFSIDASTAPNGTAVDVPGSPGWTYTLSYTQPPGSVTWQQFSDKAFAGRVNYFPVPACLNAMLVLETKGAKPFRYAFPEFVISVPNYVRLEPLPVDGKLSLSPVCSSSVEGTTSADPYDTAADAAAAIYKAYGDLTKNQSNSSAPAGSAQAKAPHS